MRYKKKHLRHTGLPGLSRAGVAVFLVTFSLFLFLLPDPLCGKEEMLLRKARYVEEFIYFVDWPEMHTGDFVLGIAGESSLSGFLKEMDGMKLLGIGQTLRIKSFEEIAEDTDLVSCSMLYISPSMGKDLGRIKRRIGTHPVLTVSDGPGLIEKGVMVNMVIYNEDVRWEINYDRMLESGFKPSSQLLRNAVKVKTVESTLFNRR